MTRKAQHNLSTGETTFLKARRIIFVYFESCELRRELIHTYWLVLFLSIVIIDPDLSAK